MNDTTSTEQPNRPLDMDPETRRGIIRWLVSEATGVIFVAVTLFIPVWRWDWVMGWRWWACMPPGSSPTR